jgi:acetyl esterase/lipase
LWVPEPALRADPRVSPLRASNLEALPPTLIVTPDQPGIWCALDFEADDADAEDLAQTFAGALGQPGWYANFQSQTESFIVYPGRIFRYPRGDSAGRAEAQAYGRQLGIPDPQLEWTV